MHVTRVLLVVGGVLAWHDRALGQSRADLHAAEELEIPGLRLLDTRHADQRLSLLGIRLGYVDADVRLGTSGRTFCGKLTSDQAVTARAPLITGRADGAACHSTR